LWRKTWYLYFEMLKLKIRTDYETDTVYFNVKAIATYTKVLEVNFNILITKHSKSLCSKAVGQA